MNKEDVMLKSLALVLVNYPRANLLELAKGIGVSKATLYRYASTREKLVKKVQEHCISLFYEIIKDADLESGDILKSLRKVIENFIINKEFINFMLHFGRDKIDNDTTFWETHQNALDSFFLRGQASGIFRIDIPAQTLTEIFGAVLGGLVEAERTGRIARSSLPLIIENLLLDGIKNNKA